MIAAALATGSGEERRRKMPDLKCLVRVQAEIPVVKFGFQFIGRLVAGLRVSVHIRIKDNGIEDYARFLLGNRS